MVSEKTIKALFLLGTLKHKRVFSHTRTMCEFVSMHLEKYQCECEIVDLVEYEIKPGVESNEGRGDEWPKILKKILAADILIFATPIWWGTYSSLIQRVIERMDALNDEFLEKGKSELANKIGGIVVSGAEDGAQHIVGEICNFLSWNGVTIPPGCSFSYLGDYPKSKKALLKKFENSKTEKDNAKVMSLNLNYFARLLKDNPIPEVGTKK